jgi:Tol biopolymer transport system component
MIGANGIEQLPDGRILVAKNEGNQINLSAVDENGRNENPIIKEAGFNLHPFVTPDNRYIVFTSNRTGVYRIWRVDIDGKNPVQLTNSTNNFDGHPVVLADGKTLVFERVYSDEQKMKLMKTSIEGGAEAEALFPESQTNDSFPTVSEDGKLLAFTSNSFDDDNLLFKVVLKVAEIKEGKIVLQEKQINADLGAQFQWMNDNKNLVYINKQGVPNIFSVALDGNAQPKPLTNFNSGTIINFNWSQDRKRLFLVRGIINSDLILIKDTGGKSS